MPIPASPSDKSGGYILFEFTNGSQLHKHKVHVDPFDASTGLYTSPGGAELSPHDTAAAYLQAIKALYNTSWSLFAQEVWRRSGTPSVFTIDGHSLPAGISGIGTPGAGQPEYVPFQLTLIMSTSIPNEKLRLIYLGQDQVGIGSTAFSSTGSGGAVAELDTITAYLLSTACMVRAHNGDKPRGAARITRCLNHRLRRKAGST